MASLLDLAREDHLDGPLAIRSPWVWKAGSAIPAESCKWHKCVFKEGILAATLSQSRRYDDSVGWMGGWVGEWVGGWFGWLVGWFGWFGWLVGWQVGRLVGWLTS